MRRFVTVDVVGAALMAALGLCVGACGGETGTGGSAASGGSGGTGGSGGGTSPFPCNNPVPVTVAGQDTGYDTCEGGFTRRREVKECPNALPSTPNPACTGSVGGCLSDDDCTASPYGHCVYEDFSASCYCAYGCLSDDDCADGSICLCGDPVGFCASSTCESDAACPGGMLCTDYVTDPGCGGTAFACQTAGDECAVDADCAQGEQCSHDGTRHYCAPISCAIGRPFLVQGNHRLADPTSRNDWNEPELTPDTGLEPAELAELADHWTRTGLMEHASVAAFARFSLQLLAVGAPPDLVERAQQAMADETRHARMCFALASAYRGHPVGPGPLAIDGALEQIELADIVQMVFHEGCVGETVAAIEAAEAARHACDPVVRRALEGIAADEARHAELAWRFVQWAVGVDASLHQVVLRELRATRGELPDDGWASQSREARLLVHGVVGERLRGELRRQALERVVRPCAEALEGERVERAETAIAAQA